MVEMNHKYFNTVNFIYVYTLIISMSLILACIARVLRDHNGIGVSCLSGEGSMEAKRISSSFPLTSLLLLSVRIIHTH